MKFYIGYDAAEHEAAMVAQKTLSKLSGYDAEFLMSPKLRSQGLLYRPVLGHVDIVSDAPVSTEFANSRFLVPLLCQEQWAFFSDCDVVFYEDPRRMLAEIKGDCAVYVVKHDYTPRSTTKMGMEVQTKYPRKNWSSVMLFNCLHPANLRLSIRDVNERPGRDLHAFYWLHDDEIGDLDPRWNQLIREQPLNEELIGIKHFTLGGPWLPGWIQEGRREGDNLWLDAAIATGVRK